MPEGPELHLASRFINKVCHGRLFGKINKSEISKNPMLKVPFSNFFISALSRGKELKLVLTNAVKGESKGSPAHTENTDVLFTFGLAGKFDFCTPDELQKHSHLMFFTKDTGPEMVLSFVDYMRFGKWTENSSWSKDRGPCVLFEYTDFRRNVLENLDASAFNKPICEALLNQKYFNGIGNYLRAEVLYRNGTPPFMCARTVLEPLLNSVEVKSEKPDLLELCHIVAMEVVNLEGDGYDLQDRADETKAFNNWLQCYYQNGMKNMADHNGRTIWFHGPAGPMAPKGNACSYVEGKVQNIKPVDFKSVENSTDIKTRARKVSKKSKQKKEEKQEVDKSKPTPDEKPQITAAEVSHVVKKENQYRTRKRVSIKSEIETGRITRRTISKRKQSKSEQVVTEASSRSKAKAKRVILDQNKTKRVNKEQVDKGPPKKISKKTNPPLEPTEETAISISDLKLHVAVAQSGRLTRGKVKHIMNGNSEIPETAVKTEPDVVVVATKDKTKSRNKHVK